MNRGRVARAIAVVTVCGSATVWQALEADHLDGHHLAAIVGAGVTTALALMFLRTHEREGH